jgi:hypothetical protein
LLKRADKNSSANRTKYTNVASGGRAPGAGSAGNQQQPGDPKKAAAAVLNIARLDESPMRLLLGRDAVRAAAEAERTRAEADRKWRSLSESTDFIDDAEQTSNPASPSSSIELIGAPGSNRDFRSALSCVFSSAPRQKPTGNRVSL